MTAQKKAFYPGKNIERFLKVDKVDHFLVTGFVVVM